MVIDHLFRVVHAAVTDLDPTLVQEKLPRHPTL